MKLTPEQHEKLLAFIKNKWKAPYECRCCGFNNWDVTSEIYQIMQFTPGGLSLGGPIVPLAPVTCSNCGNTILINALTAGIVDQPNKEVQKEAAPDAK